MKKNRINTILTFLLCAVFLFSLSACGRGGDSTPVDEKKYHDYFAQYQSAKELSAEGLKISQALPANYEIAYEIDTANCYVISAKGNAGGKETTFYGLAGSGGLLIDPLYNEFLSIAWVAGNLALAANRAGQYGVVSFGEGGDGRVRTVIAFKHTSTDKISILNNSYILVTGGNRDGTVGNGASFVAVYDFGGEYLFSIDTSLTSGINCADGYFWAGATSASGDLQMITLFSSKEIGANGFIKKIHSFVAAGYSESLENNSINTNLILDFQYLGEEHFFYSELKLKLYSEDEDKISFTGKVYDAFTDKSVDFNANEAVALVATKYAAVFYLDQGLMLASTAGSLGQAFCSQKDGTLKCIFLDGEGTQINMKISVPLLYVDGVGIPFDVLARNINGGYSKGEENSAIDGILVGTEYEKTLIDPDSQLVKSGNLSVYDGCGNPVFTLEGNFYDAALHSEMVVAQKIYGENDEFYGAVNLKGQVIIPFEYYFVYPYFGNYSVAVSFAAENTPIAYRFDKGGNKKIIPDFYEPFYGCYSFYVRETDESTQITTTKWGLKNYAGDIILPAEYQKISLNQTMCMGGELFSTVGYAVKDNQYYFFELT